MMRYYTVRMFVNAYCDFYPIASNQSTIRATNEPVSHDMLAVMLPKTGTSVKK